MSDEKRKVLEMLEKGSITPEDATRLLEALGENNQASAPAEKKAEPEAPAQPQAAAEPIPEMDFEATARRTVWGSYDACPAPAPGLNQYEYKVDVEGVENLDISWISGPVDLHTYEGARIRITVYSRSPLSDGKQLLLQVENGTLTIRWAREGIIIALWPFTKHLVVEIPRKLAARLERVKCANIASKVYVVGICGRDVAVSSTSGRVYLGGVTAQNLSVRTISSGIRLQDFAAQQAVFGTTSGTLEAWGNAEEFKLKSISGAVRLTVDQSPSRLSASNVSGEIALSLPAGMGFNARYSTVSGRLNTDFPVATDGDGKQGQVSHGNGYAKIDLNTVSGGIKIRQTL